MPSLKREEEFLVNKRRYDDMRRHFRISFLMIMIPTAGLLVVMALYYFIRVLAMLAGANALFAQAILNAANDTHERSDLAVDIPYLYFAFLFVITALICISYFFRKKQPIYLTFAVYATGAVYGLVGLINESMGIPMALYLIAYGGYGIWLSDYILRLYKEEHYLSLQEGYPNFDSSINEPKPMANTSGLYYKRSEFLKRQQKEKKEKGEAVSEPQSWEMEELPLDAELPKGNRKIDNMM